MTENEMLKIAVHCLGVQAEQEVCEECPVYRESGIVCKEIARTAISALKEIQLYKGGKLCLVPEDVYSKQCCELDAYKEIGTVKECREAVKKQEPKKPVCKPKPYNESVGFNEEWFCPSCGSYIGYFYEGMDEPEQMEYCNECGQHIARDWSDENEDVP